MCRRLFMYSLLSNRTSFFIHAYMYIEKEGILLYGILLQV